MRAGVSPCNVSCKRTRDSMTTASNCSPFWARYTLESEEQLSAKCVILHEERPDVFPARIRGVGDQYSCYHCRLLVVACSIRRMEQYFGYRTCCRWIMG